MTYCCPAAGMFRGGGSNSSMAGNSGGILHQASSSDRVEAITLLFSNRNTALVKDYESAKKGVLKQMYRPSKLFLCHFIKY